MDIVIAIAIVIAGLIAFDVAALTYGADSRDRLGDTHRR